MYVLSAGFAAVPQSHTGTSDNCLDLSHWGAESIGVQQVATDSREDVRESDMLTGCRFEHLG
ncbi:hypothetical protein AQJ43_23545 [Streptomyces avermitilis]|nr:hypothetical protein AQJ43_23545 [Streptomyces avermitilis]OOV30749.1 hypothetical protein SM007_16230 [Streptomyces avermitilis]